MATVTKKPKANQELIEQATYLYLADPGSDASERFLSAAERAFEQLAQMPGLGAVYRFESPRLIDIRRWPVPGFKSHLIFYRPTETGIDVLRVLHGARDIDNLFEDDEET